MGRKASVFGIVFCLAVLTYLYHTEPTTSDVAAMDKPDNLLIRKPTVCQYIAELYTPVYSPLYHLSDDGEVKNNLRDTIGDSRTETSL
ncbi:hypothetical protein [Bacteroides muris (ex Fokt et al. 2023)]|uniref:Uncharacterized protein n=1 Tax=Bacteroides muris (ex Fokt et al. 2023) TaxID=2937417 RepID=A0A9X2NS85_9BACE|nr:hypothetical protein [Bacteroides muris (ex Fokt et al. 2023)]MCR6504309.1 hypothetical protein [Bacteroides muris (ex Fokt et al. 2023)]